MTHVGGRAAADEGVAMPAAGDPDGPDIRRGALRAIHQRLTDPTLQAGAAKDIPTDIEVAAGNLRVDMRLRVMVPVRRTHGARSPQCVHRGKVHLVHGCVWGVHVCVAPSSVYRRSSSP